MNVRPRLAALSATALALACGCVIVNPGDVQVSTGPVPRSTSVHVQYESEESGRPAWASSLRRVLRQQETVLKEIRRNEWGEVNEEVAEWTYDIRRLNLQADTTPQPGRMRAYCDQLLALMEPVRQAAVRRDARACERAVRGCDPILDRLSREFPTEVAAGPTPPSVPTPSAGAAPGRPVAP